MGVSTLVVADGKNKKDGNGYHERRYYKNTGSICRLINYTLARGKTFLGDIKFEPKVRYCDSNCVDIDNPYNGACQIKAVKKFFKKTDGRQMYHYILSFDGSVKDPKKVYEIGLEIMDTFFDRYQTIFAVHEDTDNLHIHFVFNSVSYLTGKKYCLNYKEWYRLKEAVECKADSYFYDIQSLLE